MPEAAAAPARRRWPRLAAALLAAWLAGFGALAWLAASAHGLGALAGLAGSLSGGRLQVGGVSGRLLGPLGIAEIRWQDGPQSLRVAGLEVDWSPAALLAGRLEVTRLAAAEIAFDAPASEQPPALPSSLHLPLAVDIGQIALGRVRKGELLLAESVAARFSSDGSRHRLSGLQWRHPLLSGDGDAELQGDAPFHLAAHVHLAGRVAERDFALALDAGGPLAALAVAGRGSGALQGEMRAELTPFAAQPFSRLQAHLQGIDPAAWAAGAPSARLEVDAELLPRPGPEPLAVAGPFAVRNTAPGRLDAGRLPLVRLGGRLDWQGETARFTDLAAELAGGGKLAGDGRLHGRRLELELQASKIDAAALHARLLPSRLGGPLKLALAADAQTLAADLADRDFRLGVDAARRGESLEVARLHLAAGAATLQARGRLELRAGHPFAAEGELARFDPGRFLRGVPPAQLNAAFKADGRLQPQPVVALAFRLLDSRFNGQPLSGRGDLDLAWPLLRKAELSLAAGRNRVEAHGAFGRPGDRLAVDVDAPELTPYGFAGGLRGKAQLSGSLTAPAAEVDLQAERLGLPGVAQLRGLRLRAVVGPRPDDPLAVDLALASLTPAGGQGAAEVLLKVAGSRASHEMNASGTLAGDIRVDLAAAGRLGDLSAPSLWIGEVRRFVLLPGRREGEMRLQRPAPLRLGMKEWALGPAELAGPEWQGRLQAGAAAGRLHAEAAGQGPRLGQLTARLDAGLAGAWKLAPDAPWTGKLEIAAGDLGWLGPLLGDGWESAGRLQGEVRLAGTPAVPQVAGRLAGEGLGLVLAGQGLRLQGGQLAAEFSERRLLLTRLACDSALQPPPAPLLAQAGGKELAALAATPGKLAVQGEIGLGLGGAGETGSLDFHLERLGAFQSPEQWILLSGDGRLHWRGGHLTAAGKLRADAGWWELARLGAPRLSEDVVVRRGGETAAPVRRPGVDLDLEADLGPHFHFSGAGVDTRLAGSLRLRAAGGDLPRASGSIRTVGGRFDAYGQKLGIERGIFNFQGLLDNPALNIRAVRKGLPVEAGVEVGGTAKRPEVRLVSDPELPDAEKLSWLVLGHGSEQTGGGDASTLLAAASGLFGKDSGGVVQQLQRRFGIDEFGVRQGQLGDSGSRQATSRVAGGSGFDASTASSGGQIVSVGKRIAGNAVLSYEQALGRAENIVKLTVDLSRRMSVVGRTGSDNAIDVFYTFIFGR